MGGSEQRGEVDPDARQLCFLVDLVDGLAERARFDPSELVDPRTGASFGPFLERIRAALLVEVALRDERDERA
jgi:hypothetical protein